MKVIEKTIPSGGDVTVTDKLLQEAARTMFALSSGGRPDAVKVFVIITDSKSGGKQPLYRVVKPLKNIGVRIYVVDIGDKTNPEELKNIAPSQEEITKVATPIEASKVSNKLSSDIQRAIDQSKILLHLC